MSLLASSLRKRLALGLASGTVFIGAAGSCFWAGSSAKMRQENRQAAEVGRLAELSSAGLDRANGSTWGKEQPRTGTSALPRENPSSREARVGSHAGLPSRSATRGHGEREGSNESAIFAALEQLERQMSAGMIRARDSVVALEYTAREGPPGSRRLATGVVINPRGDVLSVRIDPPLSSSSTSSGSTPSSTGAGTTAPTTIVVHDASGKRHLAHWVAADLETGLTLLQIAPQAVRPIQIADEEPTLGSQVFVVGNPFGLGHTVSRGHIAGLDRALKLGSRQLGGLIQVQAPLYPGDSGAVVANLRGQLLGLIRSGLAIPATAKDRPHRDNDFGFALAVRDILWVADQLRAHGHVERAYLGVRLEPLAATATLRQQPEADPHSVRDADTLLEGALLLEVMAGTPAALAGLRAGDAIVAVDGQAVRSPHDLTDRLDRLPAQSMIHLDVVRGRGPQRQQMTLALRTSSRTEPSTHAGLSSASGSSAGQPTPSLPVQTEPVTATAAPGFLPPSSTSSLTAVSTTAPATATSADSLAAWRAASSAITSPPAVPSAPDSRIGQTEFQPSQEAPAPVLIPGPVRSPLRAAVPPPQAEELKLTLPRAVADRLEQLERRLEKLERLPMSTPPQEPRQISSARTP
jgi:serine protease Do